MVLLHRVMITRPGPPPAAVAVTSVGVCSVSIERADVVRASAVHRSIVFTIGFHNHGEGSYLGLLLVESVDPTVRRCEIGTPTQKS